MEIGGDENYLNDLNFGSIDFPDYETSFIDNKIVYHAMNFTL